MNLTEAERIAAEIVTALAPACDRIEVAGSVRRRKAADIKDIEVVAISKPLRPAFGEKPVLPLVKRVEELRAAGAVTYRYDKNGRKAAGDKYQRLYWGNCNLDLFIPTAETRGVIFTLRTGDSDFSRLLVTPRNRGGAMPPGMRCKDGRLWRGEEAMDTPEEASVFAALGLPLVPPQHRSQEQMQAILSVG